MIRLIPTVAAAVLIVGSCSSTTGSTCRELREPLDPASFLHVIDPGTAAFLTNPPTSGPHISGQTPIGVMKSAIDPAIQVSILEGGSALIQYDESLDASGVKLLEQLSTERVVVAPGVNLPTPVIATAWTWKLTCSEPDSAALLDFVEQRVSSAPGSD